jgi:hypothetical protein
LKNLTRKNLLCFTELKRLYGLKNHESGKLQAVKGVKGFLPMRGSSEPHVKPSLDSMTEAELDKITWLKADLGK